MKRIYLFLIAAICSLPQWAQSVVNINGTDYPVDTIENYQVGPGTWYTRYNVTMGSVMHRLFLMTVDLTNPYIQLEECQGQGQIGKTEHMVDSHKRIDSVEHHPIGSVNCNFWVVSGNLTNDAAKQVWSGLLGQPFSGTAHDGVLIGNPSEDWNRGRADSDPNREVGFFIIDAAKRAFIEDMRYSAYVRIGDDKYLLRDCNRTRENPNDNELVIFNHYIGTPTRNITNATEVVIKLSEEWAINKEIECEVTAINQQGGTTIPEGYAVLQGHGTGKTYLDRLNVGDKIVLNLVVETRTDGIRKDIREMVTGNCLVLFEGKQTIRNTNETYNNQNYPRTMIATNDEGTIVWLLVSETPGNYTSEMCSLLQNAGATYAIGMDGGGSAQMNLFGHIVNTTTEGTPRAVANSLFVVNTAPDDDVVASLHTSMPIITIPKYAKQQLTVAAYNKYGTLINWDYRDLEYVCPPEVGYVTSKNEVVCLGSGTLTAKAGNIELPINIRIVDNTEVRFRHDSILLSSANYELEIQSHTPSGWVNLSSSEFDYKIDNSDICEIDERGMIHGLANGQTTISTSIDGKQISLKVKVEIPETDPLEVGELIANTSSWEAKGNATNWQLAFAESDATSSVLDFTYVNRRNANIAMRKQMTLYGIPEKIELRLNPADLIIDKLSFILAAKGEEDWSAFYPKDLNLTLNEMNSVWLDLDSVFGGVSKIGSYPLQFNGFTIYLNNAEEKHYSIRFGGLWLHYGNVAVSVEQMSSQPISIFPNPAHDALLIGGITETTSIILYDIQGRMLLRQTIDGSNPSVNISSLPKGNYLLRVGNTTHQFIIK